MEWQATDQFGNLYVGESSATSFGELQQDLASLVEEVLARGGENCRLTVDMAYQEVSGPAPEAVSHVLRVPWFAAGDAETVLAGVREAVAAACARGGWPTLPVDLA